jgi:hypothetical protein
MCLGVKRGEDRWAPNMVNMADEVAPPILNPESVSPYEGLYEVGRCHAADTCHKTTNNNVFFELLA